ncbi:hypothetical protein GIB67_020145 [Kingdonia uniflora]|uniref:Uncharacterized protein n=1 Tax=Kingdonia uniflora TaxID=39325 RepID=A0A7J7NIC0_9MAGN|nr:hypothetical protein GIB67_020145 [Kingdonia uniflora]
MAEKRGSVGDRSQLLIFQIDLEVPINDLKIRATNPKKYCVRLNIKVILPRSTCDIIASTFLLFQNHSLSLKKNFLRTLFVDIASWE